MRILLMSAICGTVLVGWVPVHGQVAGGAQPELTTVKSDFLPGEKTIFYDDFSDMAAGDAPAHFKVRGASAELRVGGNIRQLTMVQTGSLFPNITSLPKNFTYEAEIQLENVRNARPALVLYSGTKEVLIFWVNGSAQQAQIIVAVKNHTEELARKNVPVNWSQPVKVALWVQNGRVRAFLNGEKHVDANQVELPVIDRVELLSLIMGVNQTIGYRSVRFAESTPDFSQAITSSGRYVSHGILFDTGSDRLKPESASVIQSIARGLEANAGLKLLIEGHTDSTGNADQNLDLSRRRADAVRSVLIAQFKVDGARLTTAGLGATKPMDSNDTPLGRSQNRRVEFVKQ